MVSQVYMNLEFERFTHYFVGRGRIRSLLYREFIKCGGGKPTASGFRQPQQSTLDKFDSNDFLDFHRSESSQRNVSANKQPILAV